MSFPSSFTFPALVTITFPGAPTFPGAYSFPGDVADNCEVLMGEDGTGFVPGAEHEGLYLVVEEIATNSAGSIVTRSSRVGPILAAAPQGATITDTFNRADADPMSTTASDGVGTWTSGPGIFQDCKILATALRGAGIAGTENGARVLSPAFAANQSATITLEGVGAELLNAGVMVRMQGTTDASGYLAVCDAATALKVYKVTDTGSIAYAQLGATFTIAALATGDTIKLNVSGTTLEVFHNGVSQGTRTDATWATGQPGTYLYAFGGKINTFTADDL